MVTQSMHGLSFVASGYSEGFIWYWGIAMPSWANNEPLCLLLAIVAIYIFQFHAVDILGAYFM